MPDVLESIILESAVPDALKSIIWESLLGMMLYA